MDANLSAQFLQKKCKQRGITIIDGKVGDWTLDSDTGYLNEVVTDQGDKIQGDFFFDCTGFRRLLLGSVFEEEWIDYSKWLPQNAVSLIDGGVKYKEGEDPNVFTTLDAQKHGYMFKIPLREGRTLHHDILSKDGAGKVLLRAASSGTGIIAGGPIRAACEVAGIKDVVAKSLGSSNPNNVLRACLKGLKSQKTPKQISILRGKKISEITKSRANT